MAALSAKDWATECARQELKIQTLQDDLAAMRLDRDSHQREAIRMHEKCAFLESCEVCAKAHENVETCGYCQRDELVERLNRWADNCECQCHECHQLANAIQRSTAQRDSNS
jgi:hypothetical protein